MKEKLTSLFTKIKSNPKTSIFAVLVIGLIIFAVQGGKTEVANVTVTKGDISQVVAVTGKSVAVKDLSLGFDGGGRVATAPVAVGERVEEGQVLATLDASELYANRAKAAANLSEAEVALSKSKRTSTDTYGDARANAIARVKDSYSKADDALRNKIDQFFKNPRQSTTFIQFSFKDGSTDYNFPIDNAVAQGVSNERYALELMLKNWNSSIATIDSSSSVETYVSEAEQNLNRVKTFLNSVALIANTVQASEFQYQATVDGYKQTVSTARTDIGTAITNLLTAKEKLSAAPTQTSVGSSSFDEVATQEARVASARADLASIDAQINKTIIRSPIAGLVTKHDAKVGEIVTGGIALIAVISDKNLEIEANVSEVNIGKLTVGNKVQLDFDAFPGKTYEGTLFYIEPAETLIDNVVNYKIKVSLLGDAENVKSGLTSNLKITTAEKKEVLKIPLYAITQTNGEQTVLKVINEKGETEEVKITTGIVGNDGSVEVTSGLSENDTVRVSNPS